MGQSLKLHTRRSAGAAEDEGGIYCCLPHLQVIYHTSEAISSRLCLDKEDCICDHQYSAFPHRRSATLVYSLAATAAPAGSFSELTCRTAFLKMLKAAFWNDLKGMMSLLQQLGVLSFFMWEGKKGLIIKCNLI